MTFIETLTQIDGNLLIGIQHSLNADWLTAIMKAFTFLGEYGWTSILICLIMIAFKKTRKLGILCAATIALTFICCSGIIKPLVDRARPWEVFDGIVPLIPDPGDSSFPSGHSANAAAFAFSFWLNTRKPGVVHSLHKWSYLAIVCALLIAFSRMYLGMHFPSDVLVGILVAILSGQIIYLINMKIEQRRGIINQ